MRFKHVKRFVRLSKSLIDIIRTVVMSIFAANKYPSNSSSNRSEDINRVDGIKNGYRSQEATAISRALIRRVGGFIAFRICQRQIGNLVFPVRESEEMNYRDSHELETKNHCRDRNRYVLARQKFSRQDGNGIPRGDESRKDQLFSST